MTVSLGTIPRWAYTNNFGILNAGGKLHFHRDVARDQEKTVYQDVDGLIPYTNPITLDAIGSVGLIYFSDDEPYYITLYDPTDSILIWDAEGYVSVNGLAEDESANINYNNYILNGQFRFINESVFDPLPASETQLALYWYFNKSNTTAVDTIEFIKFPVGVTNPPYSPSYYLRYNCTNVPTGEIYKDVYVKISDVNAFQGKPITVSIQQKGTIVSQLLEFIYVQHFGTGGSPSADVEVAFSAQNITSDWSKLSATTTVEDISGKTLGTNGDDYIAFVIRLPLDSVTQVDLTSFQLNFGETVLEYEYVTYDQAKIAEKTLNYRSPLNYISGLTTEYDVGDEDYDIKIHPGQFSDSTNYDLFNLDSDIIKQIDAPWAEGTNEGGFPTGLALTADTWYHVFVIANGNGQKIDAGFDSDITATNLLADATDYKYYRRIASIRTDPLARIKWYKQIYDTFLWYGAISVTSYSVSAGHTFVLDVPIDISVNAIINAQAKTSAQYGIVYLLSAYAFGSSPAMGTTPLATMRAAQTTGEVYDSAKINVITNTSGQIKATVTASSNVEVAIATLGWKDWRIN